MTRLALRISLVAVVLAFGVSASRAQEKSSAARTITVTGTSDVRIAPDEAVLVVGIDSQNKDLNAAKAANDAIAGKLLALAKPAGIEPNHIQTSALDMRPEFSNGDVPVFMHYKVSETIALTLTDLSKAESLLTDALKAGVNRVDGITFTIADPRKYRDQARTMALQAAREKAIAMAAALGQTIGKPIEIDGQADQLPDTAAFSNSMWQRKQWLASDGDGASIAGGQITIRATARVKFELQ